jgi:hypothetical protein
MALLRKVALSTVARHVERGRASRVQSSLAARRGRPYMEVTFLDIARCLRLVPETGPAPKVLSLLEGAWRTLPS